MDTETAKQAILHGHLGAIVDMIDNETLRTDILNDIIRHK